MIAMSRKYKQQGYQDEEPRDRRSGSGPRPERPEGPRGRGFGRPTATVFRCARCGAQQTVSAELAPAATCSSCQSDLHSCTNCRYFDSGVLNECRAEIVVRIARKSTRNECDLFDPKAAQEVASDEAKPSDAKAAFDALFDL